MDEQHVKTAILDIVSLRPHKHQELVAYAEMYGDNVERCLSELVQCGQLKRVEIKYPNNPMIFTYYIDQNAVLL